MSLTQTTLYGTGNFFYNTEAQNGVYQNHAFTSRLNWNLDYTAPTPTSEAIVQPTQNVALPHNLFMGSSDGYWVHRVFLNDHLVGTFTFKDQQFAIPVKYDRIESVAMPFSPAEIGPTCDHHGGGDPCHPSPGGAAALIISAVLVRLRGRKA